MWWRAVESARGSGRPDDRRRAAGRVRVGCEAGEEVTTTWVVVAGAAGCVIVLTGSIVLVRRFIGEPKPRTVPFPAGDDDDDNAY